MTDLFVGALVLLGPVWLGWSFHSPLTHTYGATSGATPSASDVEAPPPGCVAADGTQVFLPEDIAPFDGTHPSGKILLVVLGQVCCERTKHRHNYGTLIHSPSLSHSPPPPPSCMCMCMCVSQSTFAESIPRERDTGI